MKKKAKKKEKSELYAGSEDDYAERLKHELMWSAEDIKEIRPFLTTMDGELEVVKEDQVYFDDLLEEFSGIALKMSALDLLQIDLYLIKLSFESPTSKRPKQSKKRLVTKKANLLSQVRVLISKITDHMVTHNILGVEGAKGAIELLAEKERIFSLQKVILCVEEAILRTKVSTATYQGLDEAVDSSFEGNTGYQHSNRNEELRKVLILYREFYCRQLRILLLCEQYDKEILRPK